MKMVMRVIASTILITAFVLAQTGDAILGSYRLPNQLDIELFKIGDKYFGKIIGLGNLDAAHQKDINNPDKTQRSTALLGKVIIDNLEYDSVENQWVNGSMYGPEKGLMFNLKITEIRAHEIEVVGSKFFFWKTLVWKKL